MAFGGACRLLRCLQPLACERVLGEDGEGPFSLATSDTEKPLSQRRGRARARRSIV
jgi:hypothetical protein